MAGLIQNEIDPNEVKPIDPDIASGKKVATAGSVSMEPVTRTVDAPKETVAGQLDSVLSKDSPLMQRARAGAMETANSRGLINSSMAAQAGEAAVIDAATPIAANDASTYTTASRDNQQVQNAAQAQNAEAVNKTAATNATAANALAGQVLKGNQATGLANIEANYKQLIETNEAASKLMVTAQAQIGAIQADTNTSPEQKTAATQKVTQLLQAGLTVAGAIGNVDLSNLLDFSGV